MKEEIEMLQQDDINVGDLITVLRGPVRERVINDGIMGFLSGGGGQATVVRHEDQSFKGDALRVVAVDLPYLAVQILSGIRTDRPCKLDLRDYKVKRITDEYAAALGADLGEQEGSDDQA